MKQDIPIPESWDRLPSTSIIEWGDRYYSKREAAFFNCETTLVGRKVANTLVIRKKKTEDSMSLKPKETVIRYYIIEHTSKSFPDPTITYVIFNKHLVIDEKLSIHHTITNNMKQATRFDYGNDMLQKLRILVTFMNVCIDKLKESYRLLSVTETTLTETKIQDLS